MASTPTLKPKPPSASMIFYFQNDVGWTLNSNDGGTAVIADHALTLTGNDTHVEGPSAVADVDTLEIGKRYVIRALVKANNAEQLTPLRTVLVIGPQVAVNHALYKDDIGNGWQLIEIASFVPDNDGAGGRLLGLALSNTGYTLDNASGAWEVREVIIDEEVPSMSLSKWTAIENAIGVIRGINGVSGGYNTDLESRAYSRVFLPTEQPAGTKLPYCCIALDQEGETIEYEGQAFTSTWRLQGYAFFEDDTEMSLESAGAQSAAKFRDDLIRAFMVDQSLDGAVIDCSITSVDTFEGSSGDPTTWVQFTIAFEQIGSGPDLEAA